MIFFKKRKIQKLLVQRAKLDSLVTSYEDLPQGKVLSNAAIDQLFYMKAELAEIDEQLIHLGHGKVATSSILSRFMKRGVKA